MSIIWPPIVHPPPPPPSQTNLLKGSTVSSHLHRIFINFVQLNIPQEIYLQHLNLLAVVILRPSISVVNYNMMYLAITVILQVYLFRIF